MIKKANQRDLDALAQLAAQMWTSHAVQDLKDEFSSLMAEGNVVFFQKFQENTPVGFAQCQLRTDYVEGTDSSPVGYLEGIFVREDHRHKGYAGELLAACETWAREQGCTEFASDCELGNECSLRFHMAMKFTEANRIICFTKKL